MWGREDLLDSSLIYIDSQLALPPPTESPYTPQLFRASCEAARRPVDTCFPGPQMQPTRDGVYRSSSPITPVGHWSCGAPNAQAAIPSDRAAELR